MPEYEKVFSMVANHYLTKPLPDIWHLWEPEKQDAFINENRWELVEDWPMGDIYDEMENFTSEIIRYANAIKESNDD